MLTAIAPAAADTDIVDTLTGMLMLSLAIGVVAVILIAVSQRATLYVTMEQALVAPAVICSVGAAVLHLWVAPELFVAWAPGGLVSFLLAAFQAEWAFAFTRPALRPAVLAAGFVLNGFAVIASLWAHGLGPALGPTGGFWTSSRVPIWPVLRSRWHSWRSSASPSGPEPGTASARAASTPRPPSRCGRSRRRPWAC